MSWEFLHLDMCLSALAREKKSVCRIQTDDFINSGFQKGLPQNDAHKGCQLLSILKLQSEKREEGKKERKGQKIHKKGLMHNFPGFNMLWPPNPKGFN